MALTLCACLMHSNVHQPPDNRGARELALSLEINVSGA
jgi:hypothetical protein